MNTHAPGSSSNSKDFSDLEAKLLAVEILRESGVRKPVPRPSLEVEVEVESNMERVNFFLLQTMPRPQATVRPEVGGETREIGGCKAGNKVVLECWQREVLLLFTRRAAIGSPNCRCSLERWPPTTKG